MGSKDRLRAGLSLLIVGGLGVVAKAEGVEGHITTNTNEVGDQHRTFHLADGQESKINIAATVENDYQGNVHLVAGASINGGRTVALACNPTQASPDCGVIVTPPLE